MSYFESQWLKNVVGALINPATEEGQEALLAELELKADLTETQPISAEALPLPEGASTEAAQTDGTQQTRITDGTDIANIGENGGLDVNVQDQTTSPLILPMVQLLGTTSLAAEAVLGAYTIVVTSAAGFAVGQHLRIINSLADRYYFGTILVVAGTTITLDTPIDFVYLAGSDVTISNLDMSVDGSVTPVSFVLRTGSPSIPSSVDITRIIMVCEAASAVDLNKFGDLAALTRGIVFRKVGSIIVNYFNVKANKGLSALAYDWIPYSASNPAQGTDGFAWRLTFGGQSKIGVVLRISSTDNLELLVQDDLTGLDSLSIIVEGHVVKDN